MSVLDDLTNRIELRRKVTGYWVSQGISTAAELGIADFIADGKRSAEEIAAATKTNPDAIYRLLRALAAEGIFVEHDNHTFSQSPLSELLRSGTESSMRSLARMYGAEQYQAWAGLIDSVRTGKPVFQEKFGNDPFAHFEANPKARDIFHQAMTELSAEHAPLVLQACDFSESKIIADVGGGRGRLIKEVIEAYPQAQGILFDRPEVLEKAGEVFTGSNAQPRMQFIPGNLLKPFGFQADTLLMKYIVHDFSDQDSIAILKNCREALTPGGSLYVIEMVLPDEPSSFYGAWVDLHMMVVPGGRERTRTDFKKLLSAAGFELERVIPTGSLISVIRAEPRLACFSRRAGRAES